jgi:hypothetical protein
MDGGGRYQDLAAARQYLLESFEQMFPEHTCGEACSDSSRLDGLWIAITSGRALSETRQP